MSATNIPDIREEFRIQGGFETSLQGAVVHAIEDSPGASFVL